MKSVWRSLLWKEWREHRWKLAALAGMAVVTPVLMYLIWPQARREDFFATIPATLALLIPASALFLGMHAAAGERSRGTNHFLEALPAPMTRPAAAKLLLGAISIFAIVAAAIGVAAFWNWVVMNPQYLDYHAFNLGSLASPWGIRSWFGAVFVTAASGGVSLFLWMAATGVNRSDEVRAGAVGLLSVLLCWAAILLPSVYQSIRGEQHLDDRWLRTLQSAAPGGPASVFGPPTLLAYPAGVVMNSWWQDYWPYLAAIAIVHGALAAWYIARFGRIASRRHFVIELPTRFSLTSDWLGPPRRSPLSALAWKQLRESAPLPLLGAALMIVAVLCVCAARWDSPLLRSSVLSVSTAVWLIMGAFVAIVAGIGTFMDDLRPGLYTFWRSRPIDVDRWFVVKFSLSVIPTIVILAIPPLLVGAYFWTTAAFPSRQEVGISSAIGYGLLAQIALFAMAAAAMALLRHAIYASILTIAAGVVCAFVLQALGSQVAPHHAWIAVAIAFAMPTLIATTTTWLAVRNDWGWKS